MRILSCIHTLSIAGGIQVKALYMLAEMPVLRQQPEISQDLLVDTVDHMVKQQRGSKFSEDGVDSTGSFETAVCCL